MSESNGQSEHSDKNDQSDKLREFRKKRHNAYRKIVEGHTGDIHDAMAKAVTEIRSLDGFEAWVESLVDHAIRTECQAVFYQSNARMRKRAFTESGNGKPRRAEAAAAGSTCASGQVIREMMRYYLGNKPVGELNKKELLAVIAEESSRARGHWRNARLARKLLRRVDGDKQVHECVTDEEYKEIFDSIFHPPRDAKTVGAA